MKPLLIDTTLTLFSGSDYHQYNVETGERLTPVGQPITTGWTIPFQKIDAAVSWDEETVYFLSGMQVVRYRLSHRQVDPGYPKVIPFYWRGVWAADIDAVLRMGSFAYFFRKHQCIRWDVETNRMSSESAQPIASFWRDLPKRITGAVPIAEDYILFFSGTNCFIYSLPQDQVVAGPVPFDKFIQEGVPAAIDQIRQRQRAQ